MNRRHFIVAALGLFALAAPALRAASIPRKVPEFAINLADGKQVAISQYRGKVVAVVFILTTCPHCQQVIDIFSSGGTERTAAQFGLEFLGSLDLDPAIREGGDRGLPVALAGPKSPQAAEFYAVAEKLMEQAEAASAAAKDVIEIS